MSDQRPKAPVPEVDSDDESLHAGFYEHSTGGKVPPVPPRPAPPPRRSRLSAAASAVARAVRSIFHR